MVSTWSLRHFINKFSKILSLVTLNNRIWSKNIQLQKYADCSKKDYINMQAWILKFSLVMNDLITKLKKLKLLVLFQIFLKSQLGPIWLNIGQIGSDIQIANRSRNFYFFHLAKNKPFLIDPSKLSRDS